ncbi:DsbA family protein [Limimaricola hongkongensis]|uniref:Periplasmic thiol:disulfide interchange protein DsbA n=1 Tax=Limimaricola hongkongensis DSM 17492 TaxID=1122180 RepID=A0A017HGL5_9RHOB|nr:DsbA family protein [Limimaricola hongkongensis]EYD73313.1 Periplasmic thiol:disulfide interchange protein DsbA [Limimaricola hongkongensis DSM 17492]
MKLASSTIAFTAALGWMALAAPLSAQEAAGAETDTQAEATTGMGSHGGEDAAGMEAATGTTAEAEAAPAENAAEEGIVEMVQGAEDAPVTVMEYASFTCPHCRDWHETSYPQLKDYIDDGRVRFVYREVYFDRPGLWASMIARCGGEAKFFGISDMLYDQQRDWAAGGDPAAIATKLREIGLKAGLEEAQLEACLTDGDKAQELVGWFEQNAKEDGINSTPTFVINGEKHSNMAWADMAEIIDGLIEE